MKHSAEMRVSLNDSGLPSQSKTCLQVLSAVFESYSLGGEGGIEVRGEYISRPAFS